MAAEQIQLCFGHMGVMFPPEMQKVSESSNLWHPTLTCQGMGLCVKDGSALEDVLV